MFCPFCKAEYRAGISRCSDCGLALLETIPHDDSDPNFMVLLWNGENLRFLEAVCEELDKASIPVATPRIEVLLRDRADRYHLKHLKTFPFVLGVFKRDFSSARKTLEAAAGNFFPPIEIPPADAYPEPFDESTGLVHRKKTEDVLDATVAVLSSANPCEVEFVEASLDGVDIPFRRICLEDGALEVRVRPPDEAAALQVMDEIKTGRSSGASAASQEDALLKDEPPRSHFLAWFMPIFGYAIWMFAFSQSLDDYSKGSGRDGAAFLLFLAGFGHFAGMFWMAHQAATYEPRPFKYYVAALIPLAFVWYYVERVMSRKGDERLSVAARLRSSRSRV